MTNIKILKWFVGAAFLFQRMSVADLQFGQVQVDVPLEYRVTYDERNQWLNEKLLEWKPNVRKPIEFVGYMVLASEDEITKTNSSLDMAFCDMFINELRVDVIAVALYPCTPTGLRNMPRDMST